MKETPAEASPPKKAFPRGSEWRKWDLHVHTPASWDWKGDGRTHSLDEAGAKRVIDDCLTAMEKTDVAVFAIQDHCTFDGYAAFTDRVRESPGLFTKTLIPGIELRLDAPTPERLHYHLLFSPSLPVDRLRDFLPQLKLMNGDAFTRHDLLSFVKTMDAGKKREFGIPSSGDFDDNRLLEVAYQCVRVTRQSVQDAIRSLGPNAVVIMLPYSTSGGFRKLDWKKHPAEDLFYLRQAHIFEARNADDIALFRGDRTERNQEVLDDFLSAIGGHPKACVSGTDAHSTHGFGVYPDGKCTWIRGDPNFEGLLHAILEPRDRVFIGARPPKIVEVEAYPGRFIDKVSLRRSSDSTLPSHEKWFNSDLLINPGLTAIIGNKGSGKSALADILALLGNAHAGSFSFLNDRRFRARPNRSGSFVAELTWRDKTACQRKLSEDPSSASPERVRYLPQERIEDLCNEIVAEGRDARFEEELRAVVFEHVPAEQRLGATSLDALINLRAAGIVAEMEELRTAITAINRKIVDIEAKIVPEVIARIAETIQQKEAELESLGHARPQFVDPPDKAADPKTANAASELEVMKEKRRELEASLSKSTAQRGELAQKQAAVQGLIDRVGALEQTLQRIEREMTPDLNRAELAFADVVAVKINGEILNARREAIHAEMTHLETLIGMPTTSGLAKDLADAKKREEDAQARLDAPQRMYQAYLTALSEWQARHDDLVGNILSPGSLEHARHTLKCLREKAPQELADAREERWRLAEKLVLAIDRHARVKRELYASVQADIDSRPFVRSQLRLQFAVTSAVNRFAPDFLMMINQARIGSFQGVDEGRKTIDGIIAKSTFETAEGACSFVKEVLDALEKDHDGQPRRIDQQLKRERTTIDLYDFLFKFEWLRPHYALHLDGRPIPLLSPGEKGALLLVFYLLLDIGTLPLIIDQPEHNLDNESVMRLLVPCFREAARRRQVIVVTHNPNLAVVADADQVIHAKIDRQDGNRIEYTSGSLESPCIGRLAVNVLEGTRPAFEQRASVYKLIK